MKYTEEAYANMIDACKNIASEFMQPLAAKRALLDPVNNIDDIDLFEVSEDEIRELFNKFCDVMGLECELGFFRDNDEENGRYSEHTDAVVLPLCIGCYGGKKIVEHMTHELFHAFQYAAICNPKDYPCFDEATIKQWDYEFKHYISGAKDMKGYKEQEIEKSAWEFGKLIAGA